MAQTPDHTNAKLHPKLSLSTILLRLQPFQILRHQRRPRSKRVPGRRRLLLLRLDRRPRRKRVFRRRPRPRETAQRPVRFRRRRQPRDERLLFFFLLLLNLVLELGRLLWCVRLFRRLRLLALLGWSATFLACLTSGHGTPGRLATARSLQRWGRRTHDSLRAGKSSGLKSAGPTYHDCGWLGCLLLLEAAATRSVEPETWLAFLNSARGIGPSGVGIEPLWTSFTVVLVFLVAADGLVML